MREKLTPVNPGRIDAYIQLIQTLLSCPYGEEPKVLAAHSELIDTGLVQTMEALAPIMSQQGDEKAATWLRNLATQLSQVVDHSMTNPQNSLDGQS